MQSTWGGLAWPAVSFLSSTDPHSFLSVGPLIRPNRYHLEHKCVEEGTCADENKRYHDYCSEVQDQRRDKTLQEDQDEAASTSISTSTLPLFESWLSHTTISNHTVEK